MVERFPVDINKVVCYSSSMPQRNKYTRENLVQAIVANTSWTGVTDNFGIARSGGGQQHIRQLAVKWGIDFSHFRRPITSSYKKSFAEILVLRDSGVESTRSLRRALIEYGRKYCCQECGQEPIWNEKPLVIQIDHRNGNRQDNRPENVFFVCPNCHTQTDNYGSKNSKSLGEKKNFCEQCGDVCSKGAKKCRKCTLSDLKARLPSPTYKIVWPEFQTLGDLVDDLGFEEVGRRLGVTGKSVKQHLRKVYPAYALPSLTVIIKCDWCKEKFERNRSLVVSRKNRGQVNNFCNISHSALYQHRGARTEAVS